MENARPQFLRVSPTTEAFQTMIGTESVSPFAIMQELEQHPNVEWSIRDYRLLSRTRFFLIRVPDSVEVPQTIEEFRTAEGNVNLVAIFITPRDSSGELLFVTHLTDEEYTVLEHFERDRTALFIPNTMPSRQAVVQNVAMIIYGLRLRLEIEGLQTIDHEHRQVEGGEIFTFPVPAITEGVHLDFEIITPEDLVTDIAETYRVNLKKTRVEVMGYLGEHDLIQTLSSGISPIALQMIKHNIATRFGYEQPDENGFRKYMALTEIADAISQLGYPLVHAVLIRRMIERMALGTPENTISGLDRALRQNTLYSKDVALALLQELQRTPYLPEAAEEHWVSQKSLPDELQQRYGLAVSEGQIYQTTIPEFLAYLDQTIGPEAEFTAEDSSDPETVGTKSYGTFRPRHSLYVDIRQLVSFLEQQTGIYKDGTTMTQAPTHRALVQLRPIIESDPRLLLRLTPEQRGAVTTFYELSEEIGGIMRYPTSVEHMDAFPHDTATLTAAVARLHEIPSDVLYYTSGKDVRQGKTHTIMTFLITHPDQIEALEFSRNPDQNRAIVRFMSDHYQRTLTVPSYDEIVTGLQAQFPELKRDTLKITRQNQIIAAIEIVLRKLGE